MPSQEIRQKSMRQLWITIAVLIGVPLSIALLSKGCDNSRPSQAIVQNAHVEHTGIYKIQLSTCLGKDLLQPATFYLDTKSTTWTLDYNNGSKIDYHLISGNEDDPMCGLKARDSNGDRCELCFDINDRNNVKVRFNYGSVTLRCSGRIE